MRFAAKYLRKHVLPMAVESGGNGIRTLGLAVAGTLAFLLAWWVGGTFVLDRPGYRQFSGFLPVPALAALGQLLVSLDFWHSVAASLRRIGTGIGLAFCVGLPAGLLLGHFRPLRSLAYPPIQFLRMVSPLSWMPIALLLFATFESAINFLITMTTIWPILMNTMLGVSRVNRQWIDMARIEGASEAQVLGLVILPASVPYILTSLRLALGVAWIVLVRIEFLGISSGLGYLINDARDTMEYDRLMAIVLAIGLIGLCLDSAIQGVRRVCRWTWQ